MWIELQYSKGHPYLRLVENTNTFDEETQKKKRSRRVLKSIGPLAAFDDGQPNYVERLRESFRRGDPLIADLKKFVKPKEGGDSSESESGDNSESVGCGKNCPRGCLKTP